MSSFCNLCPSLLLISLIIGNALDTTYSRSFVIDYQKNSFMKDGEPFRYISGGIHYFRIPEIYWEDRLKKIRASGCNAIQTYVAWNSHEPQPGTYDFTGNNDLVKFVKLAQENDLLVIIRAGPYICAEWDFGGFPGWLLRNRSIILRSSKDANYLAAVDSWMAVLLTKLKPLIYANGGPIISVQVENEYGSYSTCDANYMKHLQNTFEKYLGKNVILFTTDGYSDEMLHCGSLPSLYTTVDFGASDPSAPFKQQRKYQKNGPLVNSEYYTGWLDHWGEPHSKVNGQMVAKYLDEILAMNASINMYMFEGGTNFGFMNGANFGNKYSPQPTSYDYDAPLSEAGDPTEKYFLLQNVISKYAKIPPGPVPKPTPKTAYGKFPIKMTYSLMYGVNRLFPKGPPFHSQFPLSMEDIGQNYGFLLYETELPSSVQSQETVELVIKGLRDRAVIMVDQIPQGRLSRNGNGSIQINTGSILGILVENQGRINYGYSIRDPKGILGNVSYGGRILENWRMYPINFLKYQVDQLLIFTNSPPRNHESWLPSFNVALFTLLNITDTYLKLDGWSKGQAIINGYNVGRYWPTNGPQQTLYVPANMLLLGINKILLFEQDQNPCEKAQPCYFEFVDKPILG